jgi:adenylate cyclase
MCNPEDILVNSMDENAEKGKQGRQYEEHSPGEGLNRKLAAILSADVEGYSALMSRDDEATVKTITIYREIMSSLIGRHRGRVVDSPGDNLLAEFGSVVGALKCAVEIQKELEARNARLPRTSQMRFRIGINLGDVIQEGKRIYGDGVNIAARLESITEPGGICLSKTAFDHVEGKLGLHYEYLGEKTLKNIPRPVGVYRVVMEPGLRSIAQGAFKKAELLWHRKAVLAAVIGLLLLAMAGGIWGIYLRPLPSMQEISVESSANVSPDKPSIAVLPFANLSGDPGQEYFSDGITEDIITALSAIPQLLVIARNSTFTYKGKLVDVQQVGRELGIRYVLEGSIQKADDRIRITAQLIDAATGTHLWAERYDRELKDIFDLQDEITLNITRAIQMKVGESGHNLIRSKAPANLDAYLKVLKGQAYLMQPKMAGNAKARQLFEEASVLDPKYPVAYVALARTYLRDVWFGWNSSTEESLAQAMEFAEKAFALDPSDPSIHALFSQIYLLQNQHKEAIAEGEHAVEITPNSVEGYGSLGMSLYYAGRFEEAIGVYEKALRLDPETLPMLLHNLGNAYLMIGRYEEAIEAYKKALDRNPESLWAHVGLAATYSLSGHEKEAHEAAARVLAASPLFSLEYLEKISPYKNQIDKDRFIGALRKAGLT